MWFGLALGLVTMAGALIPPPWRIRPFPEEAIAALGFIAFPAAVFHSLSDRYFRWTYDNNPLIGLALVLVIAYVLAIAPWRSIGKILPPLLIAMLVAVCWLRVHWIVRVAQEATEQWPEVPHLAGARMRPQAEGMRELVSLVRRATPNPADRVLLLPNDPNVEQWFERPRPPLSGPMIFTDQYWDRYVDPDFAALEADPPEVIVIGPRNYWRRFTRQWHPGWGAERLIDRVRDELLPARYRLLAENPITYRRSVDYMDVYVLSPIGGSE
jgi:hypothetical protein